MRLPTFYEQNLIPNWGNFLFFEACMCMHTRARVGRSFSGQQYFKLMFFCDIYTQSDKRNHSNHIHPIVG